jgi:peptidoglycan/LPS O-acetylase OafA/YrhL
MGLIRVLLAVCVIIGHTATRGFYTIDGSIAVEAFYIISGFYMSMILNEKYVGKGSYKLFITNRFLRLYPIYYAVIILSLAFIFCTGTWSMPNLSPITILYLVFVNGFILFMDWVVFMGLNREGDLYFTSSFLNTNPKVHTFLLVPQAWTLSIEIAFYLIAPFILRRGVKIVLAIILVSLLARVLAYRLGYNYDPWTYRFLPFEFAFFFLGNISYRLYNYIKAKPFKTIGYIAFGLALITSMFYELVSFPKQKFIFLFLFAALVPFIFNLTKKWKWDAWVGDLSYPVYIVHVLIITLVTYFNIQLLNQTTTVTILSLAASVILNYIISKPIEKYRQSRVKKFPQQTLPFKVNA